MDFQEKFKHNPYADRATGFEVFLEIKSRIEQQMPASMIRLGTGEGAVMGFPEISSRFDVNREWMIWLGDTDISDEGIVELSHSVRQAVSEADVVGIPRKKQCDLFHMHNTVVSSISQFGLLNETQTITDAAVHRYLQFSLLYRALLKDIDFLGIISSRNIVDTLKSKFGVRHLDYYAIRGEAQYPGPVEQRHYPDAFRKLYDCLNVPFPGALFLVGAGVFGKVYCKWIKDRGGIALDIGSIFEPWGNIPSRTTHPCHHLDVYTQYPEISAKEALQRYNDLCDELGLDTVEAREEDDYFLRLPDAW